MEFKEGDIIEFCDEEFVVLRNFGSSGTVKENVDNGEVISNFHWTYCGTECKLATPTTE